MGGGGTESAGEVEDVEDDGASIASLSKGVGGVAGLRAERVNRGDEIYKLTQAETRVAYAGACVLGAGLAGGLSSVVFLGLERATGNFGMGTSASAGFSQAGIAGVRVFSILGLQCPMQLYSRREAAWHWGLACGATGALEVQHDPNGMMSTVVNDWRNRLRAINPIFRPVTAPQVAFFGLGSFGVFVSKVFGVPW